MEGTSHRPKQRFTREPPSERIIPQYSSYPWAIKLFEDPSLVPFVMESRRRINLTTGDSLCGKTLATEDTIATWQSFYKNPTSPEEKLQVYGLLRLGEGVNGHIDTCHGGFLSVVLDEVLGTIAEYHRPAQELTMTAYLNVSYKRPVPTPGCILVKAWLEKKEGRKMWAKGVIEDGEGNVSTTGEALFLTVESIRPRPRI